MISPLQPKYLKINFDALYENKNATLPRSCIQILNPSKLVEFGLHSAYQIEPICSLCQKSLRGNTMVTTEQAHFCVGCFACELPSCETYQVMTHQLFEIYKDGWPARHELLLLIALEKFSVGNWATIRDFLACFGACYNTDEIQYHFDRFYGANFENIEEIEMNSQLSVKTCPRIESKQKIGQNKLGGKSIQRSTYMSFYDKKLRDEECLTCFNWKRGQFNIQYKENLEKYLANLEFKETDSQKEIEIKFQIIQAYNSALDDRLRKHNFIIQHKLLDENYQAQQKTKLQSSIYTRKAHELIEGIMSTMDRKDYLELRKSLQFCLKIQKIIDNLKLIRSNKQTFSSIKSIRKVAGECHQEGKPRKRVHRAQEDSIQVTEKTVRQRLNISKRQLQELMRKANEKNEAIVYKEIKVRPLRNLVMQRERF